MRNKTKLDKLNQETFLTFPQQDEEEEAQLFSSTIDEYK